MFFLKTLQYSQENSCVGFSFPRRSEALKFLKRDSKKVIFPRVLQNFLKKAFLQNTSGRLLQEVESENIPRW